MLVVYGYAELVYVHPFAPANCFVKGGSLVVGFICGILVVIVSDTLGEYLCAQVESAAVVYRLQDIVLCVEISI